MPTVLYLQKIPLSLEALLLPHAPEGWKVLLLEQGGDEELRRLAPKADFFLVGSAAVPRWLIEAAPRLKMIQHQGVGYERIDRVAAAERGVEIALTPEGTTEAVAEHTVLLILALSRRLPLTDAALRRGEWLSFELRSLSRTLSGRTVGLVGFGRIGQAVAQRLKGFECPVRYFDPLLELSSAASAELAAEPADSLEELLGASDIITLHAPLTPDTRQIINARTLALMRPGSFLINAARGRLVDTDALIEALQSGPIAGAALDVFDPEPPPADSPLYELPNVVLTPHIAAGTADAYSTKIAAAFDNMRRCWEDQPVRHRVPPPESPE